MKKVVNKKIDENKLITTCWKCEKEIYSDEGNFEIRYGSWKSIPAPSRGIIVVCPNCFYEIRKSFIN